MANTCHVVRERSARKTCSFVRCNTRGKRKFFISKRVGKHHMGGVRQVTRQGMISAARKVSELDVGEMTWDLVP